MALYWYPDIGEKYDFDGKPNKALLLSSYIKYFLARLQSMFVYEGLPDSIPQKWLENYLLTKGTVTWLRNGPDGDLVVTFGGLGGKPDEYYIPTEVIIANPYLKKGVNRTYIRDKEVVVMYNDTYAQGLIPMLRKWCGMLVEAEIGLNMNAIMSRGSLILTAVDDKTKESAELWLKRLREGQLGIIGESPFLVANQDSSLTVNNIGNTATTLTDLIEYTQYIKSCLYNELGLQSNYNMKREAINSNESQLNEDQLHPLIDDMLRERQIGLEKVNAMFGTNITVRFNSAWEINEREEEAAIEEMEANAEAVEAQADMTEQAAEEGPVEELSTEDKEKTEEEVNTEVAESEETETEETVTEEEQVEVTISENAIEEIAEKVAEKLEEDKEDEDAE